MKCSTFIEGITELAFGRNDQVASEHVATCAACAAMLRDLRRVADTFSAGSYNAPAEVVRAAAAIQLPAALPTLGLVRTSLGAVGARRTKADSFQCVFEGEGLRVRTMYSRSGNKWHVMITSVPPVEAVEVRCKRLAVADGRYEFEATSLDGTGYKLIKEGRAIAVPPGSVGIDDGDQ